MGDISRHARAANDIVESELADAGVELQEERERLPDAACRAEHGDFGGLSGGRVVGSANQCHCCCLEVGQDLHSRL